MNVTDPIADMLTRLRNAARAGRPVAEVPYSRLKGEIARILHREGFIADYVTEGQGAKKTLCLHLKYTADRQPLIRGLRRISKPGLRRYAGADALPRVMGGMGISILSTSRGVMSDREARKNRLGGEVLCQVW